MKGLSLGYYGFVFDTINTVGYLVHQWDVDFRDFLSVFRVSPMQPEAGPRKGTTNYASEVLYNRGDLIWPIHPVYQVRHFSRMASNLQPQAYQEWLLLGLLDYPRHQPRLL